MNLKSELNSCIEDSLVDIRDVSCVLSDRSLISSEQRDTMIAALPSQNKLQPMPEDSYLSNKPFGEGEIGSYDLAMSSRRDKRPNTQSFSCEQPKNLETIKQTNDLTFQGTNARMKHQGNFTFQKSDASEA